ncbi:hypothetical protein ACJ2A9_13150 [Anaerobacillus sp. MEB173]|uniref:hypothetical protein n=1 Tax=Anaerobacillus sp. MEB173 TaxID=3383345 RepID=UPI003F92C412
MKQRLFLCLLLGLALIYYALPRLSFDGMATVLFSSLWLFFAFCVVSGNLIGMLYGKKKQRSRRPQKKVKNTDQQKRQYGL